MGFFEKIFGGGAEKPSPELERRLGEIEEMRDKPLVKPAKKEVSEVAEMPASAKELSEDEVERVEELEKINEELRTKIENAKIGEGWRDKGEDAKDIATWETSIANNKAEISRIKEEKLEEAA